VTDIPMQIELNGHPHPLPAATTVATLVAALGYTGKRVAVECNGAIVPKSHYAEAHLSDGDRVEIVAAVGGG